jgi:hypothetical protein
VKSNFVHSLSDEAIETFASFASKSPSPYSFAPALEHWHGAATRIGVGETAFNNTLPTLWPGAPRWLG